MQPDLRGGETHETTFSTLFHPVACGFIRFLRTGIFLERD